MYLEVDLLDHMVILYLHSQRTCQAFLFMAKQLHHFTFPPAIHEGSTVSTFSPTPVTSHFLGNSHLMGVKRYRTGFNLHLPNDAERLFTC